MLCIAVALVDLYALVCLGGKCILRTYMTHVGNLQHNIYAHPWHAIYCAIYLCKTSKHLRAPFIHASRSGWMMCYVLIVPAYIAMVL